MARGRSGSSVLICSISLSRSERVETRSEREQLVERQPQRVDVGPSVSFAPEPLGGHVAEGAQDVATLGQPLIIALGQAEIRDPDHALGVQQQVRRFDVPVHDAARVGVGEARGDLPADVRQAAEERVPTRLGDRELGPPGQYAELEDGEADDAKSGAGWMRPSGTVRIACCRTLDLGARQCGVGFGGPTFHPGPGQRS